jgi:hypothetical protein
MFTLEAVEAKGRLLASEPLLRPFLDAAQTNRTISYLCFKLVLILNEGITDFNDAH